MELCVEFYFSRIYEYSEEFNDDKWSLPPENNGCSNWLSVKPDFERLSEALNTVKSRLGKYSDGVKMRSDWHKHTEAMHLFSCFSKTISRYYGSELATRAFLKFYDIMARFPQLTDFHDDCQFGSVHLCEAPGAFVCALNQRLDSLYRSSHRPYNWKWFANTLNPYHELSCLNEAIFDDSLISSHPENWLFGIDNTGNILKAENIKDIWKKVGSTKVDLVTADGAIDCQKNPAEQERILSQLHYAELVTAAGMLRQGGHFVIKLFTLFEHETASLVYLLLKLFRQVYAYKPAASKPGNSELYFACLEYNFQPELIGWMLENLEKSKPLHLSLPKSFLMQQFECSRVFSKFQSEAIERNISSFEDLISKEQFRLYNQITSARWEAEQFFIAKACAPLIRLCPGRKILNSNVPSVISTLQGMEKSNNAKDVSTEIICQGNTTNIVLTYIEGELPERWSCLRSSLFCCQSNFEEFLTLNNANYSTPSFKSHDQHIFVSKSPPSKTEVELLQALAAIKCSIDEIIVIVGVPPPVSRFLAGYARILLTRFKSIRIVDKNCWLCISWNSSSPKFDETILQHAEACLMKIAENQRKNIGIVEIVALSDLCNDESFRFSLFKANNTVLFSE